MKTPIIRKIIRVGASKAVSIPKSWLEYWERESGQKIIEVAVEVDRVLTISPILPKMPDRTKEAHEKEAASPEAKT